MAFSIAGIVVGVLELFTGLSTAAAPAMLRVQSQLISGGGQKELKPAVRPQVEMLERTAAVYERHRSAIRVNALARTAVGIAMIIGGIFCLGLRSWARKLLIGAFAAGAMVVIGLGPEMVRLQMEVTAENAAYFERVMREASDGKVVSPEVKKVTDVMGTVMKTTGSAATVMAVSMLALTAAACLAGAIFLLHPRIRVLFT